MEPRLLEAMNHVETTPLLPSPAHPFTTADDIEASLKSFIANKRRSASLSTNWDDGLSYILSPALAAYEMERLTGTPFGNDEFQQSIKKAVPEGHSFKGFPILFNHISPEAMMDTLEQTKIAQDIIQTTGDRVAFAIRVKLQPFAEHAVALWVMLAVRYRPHGRA